MEKLSADILTVYYMLKIEQEHDRNYELLHNHHTFTRGNRNGWQEVVSTLLKFDKIQH